MGFEDKLQGIGGTIVTAAEEIADRVLGHGAGEGAPGEGAAERAQDGDALASAPTQDPAEALARVAEVGGPPEPNDAASRLEPLHPEENEAAAREGVPADLADAPEHLQATMTDF